MKTTQMTYAMRDNKTDLIIAMLLFILQPIMAQAQDTDEQLFWQAVDCSAEQEVTLYLEIWPQGAYIDEARACLGKPAQDVPVTDSRGKEIERHLLQCEAHFQANRLLTGQAGNALDCYKGVLQIAPGNAQALAGITAIEDKYISWARRELTGHDVARAQVYLQRLKSINEEREEVAELEGGIEEENKRKRQAAEAQRKAQEAEAQRKAQEAEAQRKAQEAEAQRKAQESDESARQWVGKMVAIPAGSFRMGDLSGDGYGDEKPAHTVRLSAFEMGAHEVTVGQFRAFVEDSGYHVGDDFNEYNKHNDHPVVEVSWDDAQAFIGWLNEKTNGAYRLPTEAEWEYAARAGTTSKYSWGDSESQAGAYAWYGANSGFSTHAVGGKRANPWGLYDMHGNVWEWVGDWYDSDYYASSPARDPQGPGSGRYRVNRGGSWLSNAGSLRSAVRSSSSPGIRLNSLGFRLVRQP